MTDLSGSGRRAGVGTAEAGGVRDAVRSGVAFATAGLLYLFIASVWMGTCTGSTVDALACGAPQQAAAGLGAPLILLIGAGWALLRGARTDRDAPAWWAWQVTGWILVALTLGAALVALP
jgi:hypothetical protein